MAEPLVQELSLDISPAIEALAPLADALTELATNFSTALGDAISGLTELTAAPVAVTADTSELDTSIADALDAPRPPIDVEGDPTALTDSIDSAVADIAPPVVPVDADVTAAQTSIDSLAAAPVEIPVTADTTDAQDSIDALGDSATGATGSSGGSGGGGSGLLGLADAGAAVGVVTGLAKGNVSDLTGAVGGLGGGIAATVAAGAGFTAFLGETVNLAAQAQAQQARFNETFGASAAAVQNINVGGLNISLQQLGEQSGTLNSKLESSASRIGQLGFSSGATSAQVVQTTQDVLALSAAASVTNPQLGDTADVADKLTRLLATGGQRLSQYGISLSSGAIAAEALKLGLADSAAELTPFDKLVAGSTLAIQQQGDALGTRFAAGAQNAEVQLRALKVAVEETLVSIGGPLLEPVVSSLQALVPIAQEVGLALGDLGQIALPAFQLVSSAIGLVAAPLKLVSDGLGILANQSPLVRDGIVAVALAAGAAQLPFFGLAAASDALGAAFDFATGPIGIALITLGALGAAFDAFGSKTSEIQDATKTFTTNLFGVNVAGGSLSGQLAQLDTNIDKTATTFIESVPAGTAFRDALDGVGDGAKGLTSALTGTQAEFNSYVQGIQSAIDAQAGLVAGTQSTATALQEAQFGYQGLSLAQKAAIDTSKSAADSLDTQRTALQKTETQQLQNLVSTNQLTAAQLKAIDTNFNVGKSNQDLSGALDAANKQVLINSTAQANGAASAKVFATAQSELSVQVKAGQFTLADASTAATGYGISLQQATQIITDAETAQDNLAASNALGTTSFSNLVDEIATGAITIPDATAALEQLHFSEDGASAAAAALQSTISSAVSAIVKNLPQASDAAKQWQSDLSAAFSKVASDSGKSTSDIKGDLASLVADSDPAKFAADLNAQTVASLTFTEHLKTLVSEGFGQLAGFIAQQPLDFAAPFAAAVAGSPTKAKIDQAALELSQSVTTDATPFFEKLGNSLGLAAGTKLANGVVISAGPDLGAGLGKLNFVAQQAFHPDLLASISPAIAAAEAALARDPRISEAAGQLGVKAVQGFEAQFGPVSTAGAVQIALSGAQSAITSDSTVSGAAAQKGADTAAAFGTKLDVSAAAKAQFGTGAAAITQLQNVQFAADQLGADTGSAFVQGLANGLSPTNNPSGAAEVAASASAIAHVVVTAANVALGIKSPSTVGATVGSQFVAGVALGLGDTPALVVASSSIATTLVGQLKADLASLTASTSSTLSGATSSLASSALSSLPNVGTEISTFSQNLSSALSAQSSALSAVHKDYTTFGQDQQKVTDLSGKAFLAGLQLAAAQKAYDDQVKADGTKTSAAQKANLKDLSDALATAKSAYDSFSSSVRSAQSTLSSAGQQIGTDSKALGAATKALAVDSNAATFIKNLNDQTDASKRFESDLAKLVKEGLPDLASQLADAGVATAGKLADALAASPAKAKSANAAVEHANTFATAYQKELATLFGTSGAVTTAQTAGEATGTALTTGITSGLAAGGQSISAALNAQIAAVPKLTLNPEPITALAPVKAIAPVASSAPITLSGASISSGTQTLDLDLTIVLQDGKTVKAKTSVPVPKATGNLKQKVVAAVHAS